MLQQCRVFASSEVQIIMNLQKENVFKHDLVGFPLLGVSSNDASQYMPVTRSSKAKFMPYITVGVCRDLKRADH